MPDKKFIEIKVGTGNSKNDIDKLDKSMVQLGKDSDKTSDSLSHLSKVAAAVASAISVKQVIDYADAWVTVNNKLANSIRANEKLADVTQRVFDIAQNTRSSLDATASLYARLERATRDYGTSAADVAKLTATINQGFIVSGATAQEAENAVIQLSQGLASGALRGEEFNSVNEQGNRLIVALADSLGKTTGEMRALAAQGALTTDVIVNGLLKQSDTIENEYNKTLATFAQNTQKAEQNLMRFIGENNTVKEVVTGAGKAIVVASESIGLIAQSAAVFATILTARMMPALVESTMLTLQSVAAKAAAAKADEMAAAAALRRATAEKSASMIQLESARELTAAKKAQALAEAGSKTAVEAKKIAETLDLAKATKLAAEADVARIKTVKESLIAESALEKSRLASQISEIGRIETSTRMAVLGKERSAIDAQLVLAEKNLATATAQLSAAESQSNNFKAQSVAATNSQVASNSELIIAKRAETAAVGQAAAASQAETVAKNNLAAANLRVAASSTALGLAANAGSAALAIIGGPAGAAFLAAAAIIYYYSTAETAAEKSKRLSDEVDTLAESFKGLTAAQRQVAISKLSTEMDAVRQKLVAANTALNNWTETAKTDPMAYQQVRRYKQEVDGLNETLNELSVKQQAIFQSGLPSISNTTSEAKKPTSAATTGKKPKLDLADLGDSAYSARYVANEVASTQAFATELENRKELFNQFTLAINAAQEGSFEQQRLMLQASEFEQITSNQASLQATLDRINEERQLLIDNDRITAEARAEIRLQLDEQEITAKADFEQSLTEITAEGVSARQRLAEAERAYNLSIATGAFSDLLGLAAGHSRKAFELAKVGAISTAVITGYDAAVKAWDAGMSTGGPWAPAVAAGYTTASLLKTGSLIAGIKKQSYNGGGSQNAGGSGGGVSVSTGAGNGASVAPTQQPTTTQIIDLRGITADTLLTGQTLVDILTGTEGVAVALEGVMQEGRRLGQIQ